jgi:hypothetical protein
MQQSRRCRRQLRRNVWCQLLMHPWGVPAMQQQLLTTQWMLPALPSG